MAKSVPAYTWKNGFREPSADSIPWKTRPPSTMISEQDEAHYVAPPSAELVSSSAHNELGLNVVRTWPTLYDGTNSPIELPEWFKPKEEVDVLICGGKSWPRAATSQVKLRHAYRVSPQPDQAASRWP
jgi:phenol 2-monooxygenase